MNKFEPLYFEQRFDVENKKLREIWGDIAILSCPNTVNIIPEEKVLKIHINGQRHHYSFHVPVVFDDEKYGLIYESLKKQGIRLMPFESSEILIPDVYRKNPFDFENWDKEELITYILQGNTYIPDTSKYFDSKLFDIRYTEHPRFIDCHDQFKTKEVQGFKTPNLMPVFNDNLGNLLSMNKEIVIGTIRYAKYSIMYNLVLYQYYLTDELTVHEILIRGCK